MTITSVIPAHAVDRPGLQRRLDEGLTQSLTLVVAPAGAGKSVLLAQWAATHPELDFVWLEVEEADDDPARFLQRLLAGLSAIRPDIADLSEFASLNGGGLGMPLIEALGWRLSELPEVVVILEDLHHLSNPTLVADLGRLVDLLPPNIHMVLSTRVDPPIAWSRNRLHRRMTEIRQSDLALDETDSALLLERIAGRSIEADGVTALVKRTEGWAAGLQLAGMTLRLHPHSNDFIVQFSGSNRLVADYLSEQVLASQSDDRREFLLRVSVLDEMCADLVGHLTGEPNPQLVLEELERESMFLIPLDAQGDKFRFHQLFRDLLRFRLRAEDPPAEARLLRQAATWHIERGDVGPGMDYLLRARDWSAALDVIKSRGSKVFEQGQMATVIRWIDEIPQSARSDMQDISLLHAFLVGAEGKFVASEDSLRQVLTHPRASMGERACALSFLALQAYWRSRPENTIDMARGALDLLDDLDESSIPVVMNLSDVQSLRTMALGSAGRGYFLAGDTQEARVWLERALRSAGASYSVWKVGVLGSMALLEAWCGRIDRAEALAREALSVAQSVGMLTHPVNAEAYLALTFAAIERGEPQGAALSLHEATLRASSNKRGQLLWICQLAHDLLYATDSQGLKGSRTTVFDGLELDSLPPPVVAERLLALQSRLHRAGGSYERATRTALESKSHSHVVTFELAMSALESGQLDQCQKLLETLPALSEATDPLPRVEHLLLASLLANAEGRTEDARGSLLQAMAAGEQRSLVEVFVNVGPQIVRLLSLLPDDEDGFRTAILKRSRDVISLSPEDALAVPLTDRELEVLSQLPTRLTHREIAERLFVSTNTIKTHAAHLYLKLGVSNRDDAVNRARELGLL